MIIIKDVPGLTTSEILEALLDIADSVSTGYGGFVVDEDTAEQFLSAYLIAAGKRPATAGVPAVAGPSGGPGGEVEPGGPVPARTTTRRAGKRKEA